MKGYFESLGRALQALWHLNPKPQTLNPKPKALWLFPASDQRCSIPEGPPGSGATAEESTPPRPQQPGMAPTRESSEELGRSLNKGSRFRPSKKSRAHGTKWTLIKGGLV